MAKARINALIDSLSGSLGNDLYVRTTKGGRTIISQKPNFDNRQFSEAQLNVQNRTKQAAAYARVASKENPIYAQQAARKDLNAYNVAVRDWHRPPVIRRIEWEDGQVRVLAHDDTLVTGVTVTILDQSGQLLEQGEADLWMGVRWDYKAAHSGQVRVEARDLAGNVTWQEFWPTSRFHSVWEKPTGVKNSGVYRSGSSIPAHRPDPS
jgi:hypothetical protein